MSSRPFSSSIYSTLKLTRSRQPFSPPSILLCTGPCSTCLANARRRHLPPPPIHSQTKSFTTCPLLLKKQGGKGASKNTVAVNASKTANDNADPTDFSALETQITKIIDNLRDEVRYIKAGGVNVEAVEDAKVVLKSAGGVDGGGRKGVVKVGGGRREVRPERPGGGGGGGGGGGPGPKEVVRVRDLCQVVPRGRTLVLVVGEKDHIKPITAALSSPPLSLTPLSPSAPSASSSQQALEIHIPIPPTTGESRNAALNLVSTKGESALFALREARGVQKKRIRQLELSNKIRSDSARTAVKELDKVNERGVGRVKTVVEEKRKALGEG